MATVIKTVFYKYYSLGSSNQLYHLNYKPPRISLVTVLVVNTLRGCRSFLHLQIACFLQKMPCFFIYTFWLKGFYLFI
jgi:hypothetical protein